MDVSRENNCTTYAKRSGFANCGLSRTGWCTFEHAYMLGRGYRAGGIGVPSTTLRTALCVVCQLPVSRDCTDPSR